MEINELLNVRRKAIGMTLETLARKIDMSLSQTQKKLTGGLMMKYTDAVRIADGLGLEIVLTEKTGDWE